MRWVGTNRSAVGADEYLRKVLVYTNDPTRGSRYSNYCKMLQYGNGISILMKKIEQRK
jgi:hypothetical protein